MRAQGAEFVPGLRIVQVGGREDSNVYIRMKVKAAQEIGINAIHVQLPRSITEVELLDKVSRISINCTARKASDFIGVLQGLLLGHFSQCSHAILSKKKQSLLLLFFC